MYWVMTSRRYLGVKPRIEKHTDINGRTKHQDRGCLIIFKPSYCTKNKIIATKAMKSHTDPKIENLKNPRLIAKTATNITAFL